MSIYKALSSPESVTPPPPAMPPIESVTSPPPPPPPTITSADNAEQETKESWWFHLYFVCVLGLVYVTKERHEWMTESRMYFWILSYESILSEIHLHLGWTGKDNDLRVKY